jgi:SLT domain-containing protein
VVDAPNVGMENFFNPISNKIKAARYAVKTLGAFALMMVLPG